MSEFGGFLKRYTEREREEERERDGERERERQRETERERERERDRDRLVAELVHAKMVCGTDKLTCLCASLRYMS